MKLFQTLLLTVGLGATATVFADHHKAKTDDTPSPQTTCVVSGETLGEMGDPVSYTHKEEGKPDRVVQFCCKSCIGKFKKDPAKYLSKLDAPETAPAGN